MSELKPCPVQDVAVVYADMEYILKPCRSCPNRRPDPRVERLVAALETVLEISLQDEWTYEDRKKVDAARAALDEWKKEGK